MKKKYKNYLPFAMMGLVVLLIIIFPINKIGSIAITQNGANFPKQTHSDMWNGISLTSNSPYFGTLANSPPYDFCDDNDGKVTITNSLDVSSLLTLLTSVNGAGRGCSGNDINTTGLFNKGKLSGKCIIDANEPYNGRSYGTCQIFINGISVYSKYHSIQEQQQRDGYPTHYEDSFNIVINDNSVVSFYVESGEGYTGSGKAQLIIDYTPGGACPSGTTLCSDGTCKVNCGGCPSGTQLCSDGTCKADCNTPPKLDYMIYIVIVVLIGIAGFLYWIYKKKK
jgi:hypothetical protein